MDGLSALQRDLLIVIAGGDALYGDAIRRELQTYHDETISDGGLYGSLDTLEEKEYIKQVSAASDRHTQYRLTQRGRREIAEYALWWERRVDSDILGPIPDRMQ